MALRHERFYGDISAFGVITRIWLVRSLLRSPPLAAKLVFGSDFPVAPMPLSCIGQVSLRRALELRRIPNPFDEAVEMMKAAGGRTRCSRGRETPVCPLWSLLVWLSVARSFVTLSVTRD